jgi:pimeloyl-ACP methyl ester carboxylesterase
VRVGELDFDVRIEGDPAGEVVVLLHGFPQHAGAWDRVWPALVEAGHRVVMPDQRGYSPGARPVGRAAYAGQELAKDVVGLLDGLGVERAHVVGHDWGGAVAWQLGSDAPERLRTLTVVSTPHPRALIRSMVTSSQAARSWYMGAFQLPVLPEKLLLAGRGTVLRRMLRGSGLPGPIATDYVTRMLAPGALTAALNWYRALPLTRGGQGPITTPTLYVWGAGDFALGPAAAAATARYVTGPYTYVQLPGGPHWLPELQPERLLEPLLAHLSSYPDARR